MEEAKALGNEMQEWDVPHTLSEDEGAQAARWLGESLSLLSSCDRETALGIFLDLVMAIQGSDFGNLQIYRSEQRTLEIVRQRGFKPDFLDAFRSGSADSPCCCGRALRTRKPIVVLDAEHDTDFAAYWPVVEKAGYRAVQSFPLIARSQVIGVVSTHFRAPGRPVPTNMHIANLFVHLAVEILMRHEPHFRPRTNIRI